jgi:hypothetical protein
VFIYLALFEEITCGNTEIQANNLDIAMQNLSATDEDQSLSGYAIEFQVLDTFYLMSCHMIVRKSRFYTEYLYPGRQSFLYASGLRRVSETNDRRSEKLLEPRVEYLKTAINN